jgi:hypothetical protein
MTEKATHEVHAIGLLTELKAELAATDHKGSSE